MIKRLLSLGLISGLLIAGGFAISGHVNHQSSKYQVLLAKNSSKAQASKLYLDQDPENLLTSYTINGSSANWTTGLMMAEGYNGGAAISYVSNSKPYAVCGGVVNGNGATDYGSLNTNGALSQASEPNVAGPNTYQAGVQLYGQSITWYNEYNNSGQPVQQSTYPIN